MKKIKVSMICAGTLALVLSGCNNDDPVIQQTSLKDSRVISFQPVTDKTQQSSALQRAATLTSTNLTQFYVYGYSSATSGVVANLDPADVGRTGSNGIWTYTDRAEWPENGTVSFYAVTTNDATFSPDITEDGGVYTLTCDDLHSVAYHKDLLVAVKENVSVPDAGQNAAVPLYFQHALSRVRVQVRNEDPRDTIRVIDLTLVNLYTKGNLVLNSTNIPNASPYTYGTVDPIWTNHNDRNFIIAALVGGGVLVPYISTGGQNGGYVSVVGDSAGVGKADNSIMVLPQTTTLGTSSTGSVEVNDEKFYLYIQAQRVKGNGDPNGVPINYWIAVPHPNQTYGIVFEPGREYTLQVTMNANRFIHFDGVQVNDWDKTAGTGSDGNIGVVPATQ